MNYLKAGEKLGILASILCPYLLLSAVTLQPSWNTGRTTCQVLMILIVTGPSLTNPETMSGQTTCHHF
jgi:hypothetical protein